jgi:hypothetical protein
MTHAPGQKSVYTTPEFDRWWAAKGSEVAAAAGLEASVARALSWGAWRAGREQLSEATAHQRLQPIRR